MHKNSVMDLLFKIHKSDKGFTNLELGLIYSAMSVNKFSLKSLNILFLKLVHINDSQVREN